jgi:hypothetical protein
MTQTSDALINEYKGNLFEYLVAEKFALNNHILETFYQDLLPGLKDKLTVYEKELYKLDKVLFKNLPQFADEMAVEIQKHIPFEVKRVLIFGKIAKSLDDEFDEADLSLIGTQNEIVKISLKFSKKDSFINTKSAGIRSVLTNYFKSSSSENLQAELNRILDHEYLILGKKLYDLNNLDVFDNFVEWKKLRFPELPGELKDEAHGILMEFYQKISNQLFLAFQQISREDKKLFIHGIQMLSGFSDTKLYQAYAFHDHHEKVICLVKNSNPQYWENFQFKEDQLLKTSSFHLNLKDMVLQIRVKPMNVFTTPALKVNCSLKYN